MILAKEFPYSGEEIFEILVAYFKENWKQRPGVRKVKRAINMVPQSQVLF